MSVFIGFQGLRLVSRWFHGFSWFLVGFHGLHGSFMVSHSFWMVSMVFKVVLWFLVGFHGFSR